MIPIDRITVVNPRVRNKKVFKGIVENIAEIGLKRPITVTSRHRSAEHTSELQSLMRISYAVFCLKKKILNYKRTVYFYIIFHYHTILLLYIIVLLFLKSIPHIK